MSPASHSADGPLGRLSVSGHVWPTRIPRALLVQHADWTDSRGPLNSFIYNAADHMTSTTDKQASTSFFGATYTRDKDNLVATDTSAPTGQTSLQYTTLDQLCYAASSRTTGCPSPPTGAEVFSYDTADNLVSDNGTTQQFNAADELCWTVPGSSSSACGAAPTGATTYGYDPRGNRTSQVPPSGAATCSAFDQADRLSSVVTGTGSSCTSPTTVATYAYDASGLRMSKTVGGTTTTEAWDLSGGLPLMLSETSGGVATDYVEGPGGLPLEQVSSGTTLWYHHDQLGSTRVITNAAGGVVATYQYDPYGTTVASTGSVANPLQYAGQYKDAETGLYYMRARYYDPTTAQFASRDPMVATTKSAYGYVSGNPLNHLDPTGLCDWWNVVCDAGAAASAVATGVSDPAGAVAGGVSETAGWVVQHPLQTVEIVAGVAAVVGATVLTGGLVEAVGGSLAALDAEGTAAASFEWVDLFLHAPVVILGGLAPGAAGGYLVYLGVTGSPQCP